MGMSREFPHGEGGLLGLGGLEGEGGGIGGGDQVAMVGQIRRVGDRVLRAEDGGGVRRRRSAGDRGLADPVDVPPGEVGGAVDQVAGLGPGQRVGVQDLVVEMQGDDDPVVVAGLVAGRFDLGMDAAQGFPREFRAGLQMEAVGDGLPGQVGGEAGEFPETAFLQEDVGRDGFAGRAIGAGRAAQGRAGKDEGQENCR